MPPIICPGDCPECLFARLSLAFASLALIGDAVAWRTRLDREEHDDQERFAGFCERINRVERRNVTSDDILRFEARKPCP